MFFIIHDLKIILIFLLFLKNSHKCESQSIKVFLKFSLLKNIYFYYYKLINLIHLRFEVCFARVKTNLTKSPSIDKLIFSNLFLFACISYFIIIFQINTEIYDGRKK